MTILNINLVYKKNYNILSFSCNITLILYGFQFLYCFLNKSFTSRHKRLEKRVFLCICIKVLYKFCVNWGMRAVSSFHSPCLFNIPTQAQTAPIYIPTTKVSEILCGNFDKSFIMDAVLFQYLTFVVF